MASIVHEDELDLKALKEHVESSLPHYARPVFLRLSSETDTTSTFKFKKTNLVKAGFDPKNTSDPLYYADADSGTYKKITQGTYDNIVNGEIRL